MRGRFEPGKVVEDESYIPRYRIERRQSIDIKGTTNLYSWHGKSVLIYGQGNTVSELRNRISEKGANVRTIYDSLEIERMCKNPASKTYHKNQEVDILILAGSDQTEDVESEWDFDRCILNPFRIAKHIVKMSDAEGGIKPNLAILGLSRMGGSYGRNSQIPSERLLEGAYTGMLKCFKKEFPGISIKTIDVSRTDENLDLCAVIISELQEKGESEIGYEDGTRYIYTTIEDKHNPGGSIEDARVKLVEESVIVAIGGSRGIAFDTLKEVAVSKPRIVILGRTDLRDYDPELISCITAEQIKKVYVKRSLEEKAQGRQPLTPALINAKVSYEMGLRATKANLEVLERLGATVEYKTVDVTEIESLRNTLESIHQEYGRITGVIHAAGVLRDQLIKNKEDKHFLEVLETKLNPAIAICNMLNLESLEFIILFSSVAGRYGNAGQVDYASANEVLNRFAWFYKNRRPDLVVRSICWGPWDSSGMASEEVKSAFRSQGIMPIKSKQGCNFFVRELVRSDDEYVEVVAGTGPWIEYEERIFDFRPNFSDGVEKEGLDDSSAKASHYMGSKVVSDGMGAIYTDLGLSLDLIEYLDDHRIDKRCVLPAAGALELLSAFVRVGWPGWHVSEVKELRVLKGIVLDRDDDVAYVRIKGLASTHASAEEISISATIEDPGTGRISYKAHVILRAVLEGPFILPTDLSKESSGIVVGNPYEKYLFHGRRFRLIEDICSIGADHICALVRSSAIDSFQLGEIADSGVFDIGLIDTVPQLAIVWAREIMGTTVLPSRFGAIQRFSKIDPDQQYTVMLTIMSAETHKLSYDASIISRSGEVVVALTDLEGTCNEALNRVGGVSA